MTSYIDRVRLKHDLVENISSDNTLHIFTLLFMIPSLYCRYIKINITEKPSLYTGLFTGEK